MNIEGNLQKKPINYGRDGEGYVDLGKAKHGTMKKLIEGNLPKNQTVKAYDLAGNLVEQDNAEKNTALSFEKINAITENIKSQIDLILAKKGLYESKGMSGEEVEKLLEINKQDVLEEVGFNEIMCTIIDDDSFEIRESKDKLKSTIDKFKRLGEMTI